MAKTDRERVIHFAKPGLLLCEGRDEQNFFSAMLEEMGLSHVQVEPYDGKEKLREFLSDLAMASGFSRNVKMLAVTRDADNSASSARAAVESAIANSPLSHLAPSIFVLPGGDRQGSLESLWLQSLAEAPLASCVDAFFQCIESKGWKPSDAFAKNEKARAQLWIATSIKPDARFGHVAMHGRKKSDATTTEKWVDFDHPAFAELKEFLLSAFTPAEAP